jgi:hypothetical protein
VRFGLLFALAACGDMVTPVDASLDAPSDVAKDVVDARPFVDVNQTADANVPEGAALCGHATWCDPTTQYCMLIGIAPPGYGECMSLPDACVGDVTCACFDDAGAPCGNCTVSDAGLIVTSCIEP